MGTEKRDQNEVYTQAGATDDAVSTPDDQQQLSFFDAAIAPTMNNNSTNTDASEPADTPETRTTSATGEAAPAVSEPSAENADSGACAEADATESQAQAAHAPDECLGQRLRAAREARGLSAEDAAQRLKLPLSVLHSLEMERYDRIGQGIYLRGYLTKYLQLLDLPQVLADRVLKENVELPPLTTSGTVSRPRYLFERYSGSALYLILTAVIIVPAVLLATRAGFDPNVVRITPLDGSEAPTSATTAPAQSTPESYSATSATEQGENKLSSQATPAETPLIASMTPFPQTAHETASSKPADEPPLAPGEHLLRLVFTEPSWVEITATDGQKLEFGLLSAGTARTYHSRQSMDVRLGNVNGASVEVDGKAQDLAPFRHANVARFRLNGGDTEISHSGG
jgi:cytoskeleton protein RodZ